MDRPTYEPSEAEIAEQCRRIQARWTKRTERERRKWTICRARIPVVDVAPELAAGYNHEDDVTRRESAQAEAMQY